jgi:hypothetical protein
MLVEFSTLITLWLVEIFITKLMTKDLLLLSKVKHKHEVLKIRLKLVCHLFIYEKWD